MKKILNCFLTASKYLAVPVVLLVVIPYKILFDDNVDKMLKAEAICKKKGHLWKYGDHGECLRGCGNGVLKMGK